MDTSHANRESASNSLRVYSPDYFIMALSRATFKTPPTDRNPLRRCLRLPQANDALLAYENMCPAMWQLMERR